MGTTILSNGSKWAGESPDPLSTLLERLAEHPLDPTFERYGNFILKDDPAIEHGCMRFWGNFAELSAVFSVDTDDVALIELLTIAIRTNQQRPDYQRIAAEQAAAAVARTERELVRNV